MHLLTWFFFFSLLLSYVCIFLFLILDFWRMFPYNYRTPDKWYPSILHKGPRAPDSSWRYGIQNGLIFIDCMRIDTNHFYIYSWCSAERSLADSTPNSIISFNVIFSLLNLKTQHPQISILNETQKVADKKRNGQK